MHVDQVRRGAERLLGEALVVDPVRIERGYGNENWRLRTADRELLLKVAHLGHPVEKAAAAARAQRLAVAAGVPAPVELAFVPAAPDFENRLVRLSTYLPGVHPTTALTSPAAVELFFTSFGQTVARLHTVTQPAFTSRVGGGSPQPTWADYVAFRIPQIIGRLQAGGALSDPETDAMMDRVQAVVALASPSVTPTVVHRDLYLDNVLAGADGRVAALIDFDGAECWDAAADLAKPRWQVFPFYPGSEAAFMAGYAEVAGTPAHFAERIFAVEVLELSNHLANSVLQRNHDFATSARTRLAEVLAADW